MKQCVILLENAKQENLQHDSIVKHTQHLQDLYERDLLVLCGPLEKSDKAIIVLKNVTLEQAQQIAENDPLIQDNFYSSHQVYAIKMATPDNNWLLR